jgi:F0F1-type ATP synthase membrane subunit c/vacuolar-type H+-ATPase subunit K
MNDDDARRLAWHQLLYGAAITVGATMLAIGFTFSITAETLDTLTIGQKEYLRSLFFSYLILGESMIFVGLWRGWFDICKGNKQRDKGQKKL